jgi:hypothetical protein
LQHIRKSAAVKNLLFVLYVYVFKIGAPWRRAFFMKQSNWKLNDSYLRSDSVLRGTSNFWPIRRIVCVLFPAVRTGFPLINEKLLRASMILKVKYFYFRKEWFCRISFVSLPY